MKQRVLVIAGPTAVGKTALSLELAERLKGEIISGDSMQVYRGMDIGTAKVSKEDRARIPHHLIDIRDPDEPYTMADFQQAARRLIGEIAARGRLPIIVGGTGLYIEAACFDYRLSPAGEDPGFRAEMKRVAREEGEHALHARLRQIDEATAARLHPHDVKRVIRALEVYHMTGRTLSEFHADQEKKPLYDLCLIGLTMKRSELYQRIERRVDAMIAQGLVAEVRALYDKGYSPDLPSMQALGYKEIMDYIRGRCTLDEAIEKIKRGTRHYAKRQLSWFRHMRDLVWVELGEDEKIVSQTERIRDIIAGKWIDTVY